jgi:predicted RNase H-like nuclease (RuvC/YqgF family)
MSAGVLMAQRAVRTPAKPYPPMMRSHFDPMQKCMEELKLSEAQMNKFAESKATFERQQNTLEAELSNLRLDVQAAYKAENFKRVKELNRQITDKELALKNARVDMLANQMKELNKEQKEIMLKNMNMMMGNAHRFQMRNPNMLDGNRLNRRPPGMGVRQQDCEEECDDCDGERKLKNRK